MSISEVKIKSLSVRESRVLVFPVLSGWIKITYSDEFLQRLEFKRSLGKKEKDWESKSSKTDLPGWLMELKEALEVYFKGRKVNFSPPLDFSFVPPFHQKVYLTAQKIPYGETKSYKWVAAQAGNPKASRAVGQALKSNPFLIIVPCHRVLKSNGSLGGWSGEKGLKEELLKLEKAKVF